MWFGRDPSLATVAHELAHVRQAAATLHLDPKKHTIKKIDVTFQKSDGKGNGVGEATVVLHYDDDTTKTMTGDEVEVEAEAEDPANKPAQKAPANKAPAKKETKKDPPKKEAPKKKAPAKEEDGVSYWITGASVVTAAPYQLMPVFVTSVATPVVGSIRMNAPLLVKP